MPRSRFIEDYFSISLLDLRPGETIPFDVHLYFSQNRHVLLLKNNGELITDGFLDKYAQKGLQTLWVHRDDTDAFQSYLHPSAAVPEADEASEPAEPPATLAQKISETLLEPSLPPEEKKEAVGTYAQELLRQSALPVTPKSQNQTNQQLRNAVSEILKDVLDETRDAAHGHLHELWKLADVDPDFEHAVNVSTFAVIFAMAFGRIDSGLLADLALAGLLHDIGLSQIPSDLASIPWRKFTTEQAHAYSAHVAHAVELIREFSPEVPERVRLLISQHHEKFDGTGYPQRLHGFKVDDIAQLLSIADILDSFASGQWDGSRRTLKETFEMLEKLEKTSTFPEYFNPDVFAAVIGWIRSQASRDARAEAVAVVKDQTLGLIRERKASA